MDVDQLSSRTTTGVLFRQVKKQGERILFRHYQAGSWQGVSWAAFGGLVELVALGLINRGIKPGERVALMSENRLEWLICDFGIQAAGAVTVPIYSTSTPSTVEAILNDSQAVFGFVADGEIRRRLQLATIDLDQQLSEWLSTPSPALAEVEARCQQLRPDDLATIVYTSGTTGQPKGVMLAHRNLVDSARSSLQRFQLSERDVALSILPYSHVLERVNGVLVELMGGGTIWLSRGHDKVAEDLLVCQPTVLIAIPSLYEKLYQALKVHLKQRPFQQRAIFHLAYQAGARRAAGSPSRLYPLADRLILKPLRQRLVGNRMRCLIVGGASLSTKVEEFFWAVGLPILQGWGMTETSSAATANTESEHRVGSVGQPLPAVELRIAEDGEIWVKGPGNMLGYFHNEAITTETVTGEWMKTGDIGYLDDDGFLYLTDRKKELIKTAGGKYVAPQQLESRLQQQSLIDRAVVIGDQRPYITALLVPNWDVVSKELGLTGNPTELVHEGRLRVALQGCINRLNSELERWETIKRFTLLPAKLSEAKGELTPTLKLRRKVIIERYKSLVNQIYERKDGGGE